MNLEILIKHYPDVNLSIKAGELKQFGEQIATRTVRETLEKKDEKIFSRNDVVEKFKICSATLWRWEKMNLINSKKIGNRVFYPESEINRLLSQKGGSK